jgi:putative phosphoribosyl transferase
MTTFLNRRDAGAKLAEALERFHGGNTLVLGVPRGGVIVAAEVARSLGAPLDVVLARKLGAPDQPELAIGAVVGGVEARLLDPALIRQLGVPEEYLDEETRRQREEIRRRIVDYRGDRPPPALEGKTVILVDDGIATGYTVRAAIVAILQQRPARLVVAVPVAPAEVCEGLQELADEVVCLSTPDPFYAVGAWYEEFGQNTDDEVRAALTAGPSTRNE